MRAELAETGLGRGSAGCESTQHYTTVHAAYSALLLLRQIHDCRAPLSAWWWSLAEGLAGREAGKPRHGREGAS